MNQNAEPGWLAGEVHGVSGWFPEAYVECLDSDVGLEDYPEADGVQRTQLEYVVV